MQSRAKRENRAEAATPPLSTLLSQVLVAFTIEFDNEAERKIQHWTTASSAKQRGHGVWLVSMAMWSNCMRLVPEQGIRVGELERQARTDRLQLAGMERWGYVAVAPDQSDPRTKPPPRDWLVRPTAIGLKAQGVWRPLFAEIEDRWQARFGEDEIAALRESLSAVLARIDFELPEYLPITGYGLFSHILIDEEPKPGAHGEDTLAHLHLPALLAKVLAAFTIEFELDWKISLPVSANILRFLSERAVRMSDLPNLSGISKEGVAFATGWLERNGYAVIEPDPAASRGKLIWLTAKGMEARHAYPERLTLVEKRWEERFGDRQMAALRGSLNSLIQQKSGGRPLLSEGLIPYPKGWRARKPYLAQTLAVLADPDRRLPHHPMVLHRGGYPDGS